MKLGVEEVFSTELNLNSTEEVTNSLNEIKTAKKALASNVPTDMIESNLKSGWTINRISIVDLALLKIAIYEIIYLKVPYKIVINEVVNYAKIYGAENSGSFINGVLASIVSTIEDNIVD